MKPFRPRIRLVLPAAVLLAACVHGKGHGVGSAGDFAGTWYGAAGRPLADGGHGALVLRAFEGPERCGLQGVAAIELAWPVGTTATAGGPGHLEFVRDTTGAFSPELEGRFDPVAAAPQAATYTGFHHAIWQLWVDPGDDDSIYLVGPARTERWPRSDRPLACA